MKHSPASALIRQSMRAIQRHEHGPSQYVITAFSPVICFIKGIFDIGIFSIGIFRDWQTAKTLLNCWIGCF